MSQAFVQIGKETVVVSILRAAAAEEQGIKQFPLGSMEL